MRIYEIQNHPIEIDGYDLAFNTQELHHTPEDFDDGDIFQNIIAFGRYTLQKIPVAKLRLDMFSLDDERIDAYSELNKNTSPPIIYDPIHNIIIDGNHRANAAAKRGDKEIVAYVGVPETYDPTSHEDDDEWHPEEDF